MRFIANALPVAQVDTLTVGGTIEADDVFLLTINGKTLRVAAGSTAAADVASAIAAAWNDSAIPEFAEITAEADGATVVLTADVPGRPFSVAIATTEAGGGAADGQTFTRAATTACSGPNFWNAAANWDTGAVPADDDDVYLDNSNIDLLYGLDQHTVALASLHIAASYTGRIGLPEHNGAYREYRERTLRISAGQVRIGYGPGPGSSRIRLDTGSQPAAVAVLRTGTPAEQDRESLYWVGSHAGNTLEVVQGSVAVATEAGAEAQVAPRVGHASNVASDAIVRFGAGVTLGDLHQSGGVVELNSDAAAVEMTDGTLVVAAGAVDVLDLFGGTAYYNSPGTLGTARVGPRGRLDFSQDMTPKTVANPVILSAGATLHDPFGVAAPDFVTDRSTLADVRVVVGHGKTYSVT